jgi:hypothetical protein
MKRVKRMLVAVSLCCLVMLSGCVGTQGDEYQAVFTEDSDGPMIENGATEWGKTTSFEFEVNDTNLTRVTFDLAWYDDSGDGCDDTFELTVISASPSAVYQPQQTVQGTSSSKLTVVIEPLPENRHSGDREEMEGHLRSSAHSRGIGDWKVSITCVNVQADCPDPKASDNGNSWVLTVSVYHFKGEIMIDG